MPVTIAGIFMKAAFARSSRQDVNSSGEWLSSLADVPGGAYGKDALVPVDQQ